MKIYHITDLTEQLNTLPCALSLGNFDGVHLGHRALIKASEDAPYTTAVFTFSDKENKVITPIERKAALIESLGVELLFVAPFSLFKSLTPDEFITYLADKLAAKHLVCGFNFRFGKGAVGTSDTLRALAATHEIGVTIQPAVEYGGITVSATAIRALLAKGDIQTANLLLGTTYTLSGEVVRGFGIGKTLSFATLNLALAETPQLLHGVYITEAVIEGKRYPAITNIGKNPTFSRGTVSCETHLLNVTGDFYEKHAEIRFLSFLREETSFPTPNDLKKQVLSDIEAAADYHKTGGGTV